MSLTEIYAICQAAARGQWAQWEFMQSLCDLGRHFPDTIHPPSDTHDGAHSRPCDAQRGRILALLCLGDVDIYDFIQLEEEERATRILDEHLVKVQAIPIDLDLGFELPTPDPTEYQQAHCRRLREANGPRKNKVMWCIQQSQPTITSLDTAGLRTTTTAWMGVRISKPELRTYNLAKLHALGMIFLAWDRFACQPLIDAKNRLFALLAGHPAPHNSINSYQEAIICGETPPCTPCALR
ncbi:hypothetical protein C8R43DRAFT_1120801 [Mycena crocata]|nr:hypothetical protein C8R43DRAFT_1120801 [Mycena crocata]